LIAKPARYSAGFEGSSILAAAGPGNVRQVEKAISRAVIFAEGG